MSGASKANQRQSRKRAGYYATQRDKTPINKIIKMARHVAKYKCRRTMDRLKQVPAIDKYRAYQKCTGHRIGAVILSAS